MTKLKEHIIQFEDRWTHDEDTGRQGREHRAVILDGRHRHLGSTDYQPTQFDAYDEAVKLIARWREEEQGEET